MKQQLKIIITMILLVMIQYQVLSQKILKENEQNYYCYTAEENKILSIFILYNKFKDSIIDRQIILHDNLKLQVNTLTTISNNKDSIINLQKVENVYLEKQNKLILKKNKILQVYNYVITSVAIISLIILAL